MKENTARAEQGDSAPKEDKKPQVKTFHYRKEQEITPENALVEMAKDLREMKHFLEALSVTAGGRLRVSAFNRGGPIERIQKDVHALAQAHAVHMVRSTMADASKARAQKKAEVA